jgi:hypothetical protein
MLTALSNRPTANSYCFSWAPAGCGLLYVAFCIAALDFSLFFFLRRLAVRIFLLLDRIKSSENKNKIDMIANIHPINCQIRRKKSSCLIYCGSQCFSIMSKLFDMSDYSFTLAIR